MQEEFDSIKQLLKKADKKDSKREVFGVNINIAVILLL